MLEMLLKLLKVPIVNSTLHGRKLQLNLLNARYFQSSYNDIIWYF